MNAFSSKSSKRTGPARAGQAALVFSLLLVIAGCGYPEVSPKAYELSKTLYSTCNLKRESDLEKIDGLISEAEASEELTASEAAWLSSIVDQARSGEWEAASREARKILEDQADG